MSSSPLEIREIPGDCGLPFFGALRDRFSYFYSHGELQFFKSRMNKYQSTVFRCNMPPGPFFTRSSAVVCLLDAVSFQTLFDNSKVEKKDILDGTFMPSTAFTGGYRACAYLDPSETKHAILKGLFLSLLSKKHASFIPLFQNTLSRLFAALEDEVSTNGASSFNDLNDTASFGFVFRLLCDKYPSEITDLASKGSKMVDLWLFAQLAPLMSLGLKYLPNFLEDLILRTIPLPFFFVKSGYRKIYDAIYKYGGSVLDEAEKLGLERDEACHNLVFLAGFNAYGGMKAAFPALIKWIASAGEAFHRRLRDEIRTVVKDKGVTVASLNEMPLTKSAVYEALRIEPPVPYQYGRAKSDMEIKNHESSFLIKKGEILFGFQPIATKDPKVFKDPELFIGDRFMGDGEELLRYVYWSNGRETDNPTVENKQCPAKDMAVLLCRLMVVELFMRYDTFRVEIGRIMLGSSVTFTSLTKAMTHSDGG